MIVKTVAERLLEAEAALHEVRLGRSAMVVKVDGREVHFRPVDLEELVAYVDELKLLKNGARRPRFGAIGVRFG